MVGVPSSKVTALLSLEYIDLREWRIFIYHVTMMSKNHVTLRVGSSYPKSPPKFGVHKPYGTGYNDVCNISFNSNSNSNAEVPMLTFTNDRI